MEDVERSDMSLYEFFRKFPDEEAARRFFAEEQWGKDEKNRFCPHCGSVRTVTTTHHLPYRCKDCRKRFSIRTGTVLAESNLSFHKWLMAMYLLNTNRKGISSCRLAEYLGVTQGTAWFVAHRIRKAFEDQQDATFDSDIEIDEAYMGGRVRNMHRSKRPRISSAGPQDMTPVVGIRERSTGKIKAKITRPVSGVMLRKRVMETARPGVTVYTDQNRSYKGLVKRKYRHRPVNHGTGEYVRGEAHTNGIESFWSTLKRGHAGVYHKMSKKHLQRYIDEYAGRHNIRSLGTIEKLEAVFRGMKGKRLPYKELVREKPSGPFSGQ